MKIYRDQDTDLSLIKAKQVTIIGYGSQGHAHAQNLHDSGVCVEVGLRKNSPSWQKAEEAGLKVTEINEAVSHADFVMVLLPDESIPKVYTENIEPHMKQGGILAFAHGFCIHYQQVLPRPDLDVILVAPKGQGHAVRSEYLRGKGIPTLIAVHQNCSGQAKDYALSYAAANGATRVGVMETSFREETETDLFGEQAVLCGGMVELVKAGFETLVDAGYAPEIAYFECLLELKIVVDLLHAGGIAYMNHRISNTAEYGEYLSGPEIINEHTRAAMHNVLKRIQTGEYAKMFILEGQAHYPSMAAHRHLHTQHLVEKVGLQLRTMMPGIAQQSNPID